MVQHRNGQPLRAVLRLDSVAIAPSVLVVLHIVVVHEHVRTTQLIEEAKPGQISGLQHDERAYTGE
jgi:hypothetical protein